MNHLYLKASAIATVVIIGAVISRQVSSTSSGAPSGYSGDPGNSSKNCATSCHTGAVIPMDGLITSNIPSAGYTPGNTYTITGSVALPSHNEFGFQISPQDAAGNLMGTLVLTNTTETKLVGSGKYVTHTTAGNTGLSYKTWSFDWTAPASGGAVTFYGAFLASNNDGAKTGDTTFTSMLALYPLGIEEKLAVAEMVSVFPNPVSERMNITYRVNGNGPVQILLTDVSGKTSKQLLSEVKNAGTYSEVFELGEKYPSGVYFLRVLQNNSTAVYTVLVN